MHVSSLGVLMGETKNQPIKKVYRVSLTNEQANALKSLGIEINAVIQPKEGELDPSTIKIGDLLVVEKCPNPELVRELIVVDDVFENHILSGNYRVVSHLARDKKIICRFWTESTQFSRNV